MKFLLKDAEDFAKAPEGKDYLEFNTSFYIPTETENADRWIETFQEFFGENACINKMSNQDALFAGQANHVDLEVVTLPDYLAYTVLYSDGVVVGNNHKLSANSTETYKVRVEFKKNINANQLPSSQDTLVFKFNVSYVQADDNGINKPSPYVYTTNVFNGIWSTLPTETNTSVVWLGQPISNEITTYQTPAQALGENSDDFAFLKHRLTNNIVTESYAGFVITDAMAQANPGMTAGTYYLKGRKTKEYVNGSWQCMSEYDDGNGNCIDPGYNTNKATLISAFGSSNCTESPEEFYCHSRSNSFIFSAYAHPSGIVESFDDLDCMVSDEGFSGCYEFW